MNKKILTNINAQLTLSFQNITFGKSGTIAHGNMFLFKELVNNELTNGSISKHVDIISENGYGLSCLCNFEQCMKLELTNDDGFLSSITTKWNYTFVIDFELEAKNVDELIDKINSTKVLFNKYAETDASINSISGTVNEKPMSKASSPRIELNDFLNEYQ
jgi:hypothetical protein